MADGQLQPLPTRDPFTGGDVVVTRLECEGSGVVIEGRFTLGWVGRLTPEQLDFVGLLLRYRNNLQRLASDLGVAYNTARSRLDDVVAAVDAAPTDPPHPPPAPRPDRSAPARRQILEQVARGELDPQEAARLLRS